MVLVDIGIALVVAIVLSWALLRYTRPRGPWQKRWAVVSGLFLATWAGGAWLAPIHASGWVTYWIPFTVVGVTAALIVAVSSPIQPLDSQESADEFAREQGAVLLSVTLTLYTLLGGLLALAVAAYFR